MTNNNKNNKLEGMLEDCKKNSESGHCSFLFGFGGTVGAMGVSFLHGLAYSKGNVPDNFHYKFIPIEALYTGMAGFGYGVFFGDYKGMTAATGVVIALEAAAFGAGYGLGCMLK